MIAQASPNIAFLKYWGKYASSRDEDRNLALNASLSMTLSKARTRSSVEFLDSSARDEIFLDGRPATNDDVVKITAQVNRVCAFFGQAPRKMRVHSRNNFPKGAGIASSASGFAAITAATIGTLLGLEEGGDFLKRRRDDFSRLARRGSGSASRSVAGGFMLWDGEFARVLPVEWPLYDTILIFSKDQKTVSSSLGHVAATRSRLFPARLERIPERLRQMERALHDKDLSRLGPLIETDALEMHEIARSGDPAVDYWLPSTRRFVEAVGPRQDRDFWMTIDAGPNIHLISEAPLAGRIPALLAELGLKAEIWEDRCGEAPHLATGSL